MIGLQLQGTKYLTYFVVYIILVVSDYRFSNLECKLLSTVACLIDPVKNILHELDFNYITYIIIGEMNRKAVFFPCPFQTF